MTQFFVKMTFVAKSSKIDVNLITPLVSEFFITFFELFKVMLEFSGNIPSFILIVGDRGGV